MPDRNRQARRRKRLKLRQSAERRRFDRREADYFSYTAIQAFRAGNVPGALRAAKKALALAPEHGPALELAGRIHFEAAQYPDAAYYFGLLRKIHGHPVVIYNCGLAHMKMGRRQEATAEFHQFLKASEASTEPKLAACREDALYWLERLAKAEQAASHPAPAATKAAPRTGEPPVAAAPPAAAPPPVSVELVPPPGPDFSGEATGTLADYTLRRGLQQLRLAQSFEDLVCLPSLNGVDSYVFQQETVRKVLRQFKGRALLADEVGLGKTIEACLTLKEYWSRGMVRRALVLAPSSLVTQWKGELGEKFGLAAVSPDGLEFRRDPEQFWKHQPLVVASIALARLEPHASRLAGASWDMVIVDEAHCLKNRASANWKLVNALQKRFLLMLTATPVENNLIELYNLITVLKPGLLATEAEFRKRFVVARSPKAPRNAEQLRALLGEVMVRNTRSAVDVRLPHRVASSVIVPPSAQEVRLYELVSAFVRERYRPGTEGRSKTALALKWLQRQAGSSPQALSGSIGRALAGESWLSPSDRRDLEAIQEAAAQIRDCSKVERLGQMLAVRSSKIIVFTEFAATLEQLAQTADQQALPYALFRGDMPRAEKDAAIARFRDEVDVLLSTGAGGEGRNLQFANTVINFDMPWSPMRLEQRVGRVHRIGQTREVFVFNLCQAGTVEEQLLRLLHDKINMFELVVGEMDAILGSLDEEGDFADLVLELWISSGDPDRRREAFDVLAEKLLAAKNQYGRTKELDAALFGRDFEV